MTYSTSRRSSPGEAGGRKGLERSGISLAGMQHTALLPVGVARRRMGKEKQATLSTGAAGDRKREHRH